jgi:hypothetical protein
MACGARPSLRIGWLEAGGPGHKDVQYRLFSGLERTSFRAQAGQTIELDYDVAVEAGSLEMTLNDPDGDSLWQEVFEEDAGETVRVEAPQTGRYRLRIEGKSTRGGFEVAWQVE